MQPRHREALELIQSSYLLKIQARHICVRWVHVPHLTEVAELTQTSHGVWRSENVEHPNANLDIALNCFATRFQNAVTLEIICDDE